MSQVLEDRTEWLLVSGALIEYRLERAATDARPGAIVFLHEGLGSIQQWRDFPTLVRAGLGDLATLAYSRHGYGNSARRPLSAERLDLECEASTVLPEILRALDIRRPVLVGHSDGATIAAMFAAIVPVAGLVLIAPHVVLEDAMLEGIRIASQRFTQGRLRSQLGRYHRDPGAVFETWCDSWLELARRNWSIEDRLGRITAPTLVIQGLEDQYGTRRQLDVIAERTAGPVRLVELPRVGHAPHLEKPALTANITRNFIRHLDPCHAGHCELCNCIHLPAVRAW